MGKQVQHT